MHGESGIGPHLDLPAQRGRHQFFRGNTQVFDHAGHGAKILLAGWGQGDLPMPAHEQVEAEKFLQRTDLAADCTRRDVQLIGGMGNAQMTGDGLECADGIEWWQSVHGGFLLLSDCRKSPRGLKRNRLLRAKEREPAVSDKKRSG
ncbi:hypothetical protein D3C80_466590 [compost metagenome]